MSHHLDQNFQVKPSELMKVLDSDAGLATWLSTRSLSGAADRRRSTREKISFAFCAVFEN